MLSLGLHPTARFPYSSPVGPITSTQSRPVMSSTRPFSQVTSPGPGFDISPDHLFPPPLRSAAWFYSGTKLIIIRPLDVKSPGPTSWLIAHVCMSCSHSLTPWSLSPTPPPFSLTPPSSSLTPPPSSLTPPLAESTTVSPSRPVPSLLCQIIVEALGELLLFLPGTTLATSPLQDVTYRGELAKR
jgi:hypothetical protein